MLKLTFADQTGRLTDEKLRAEAEKYINQLDKYRSSYYTYHTGREWKRPDNYDLCLDTASLGLDNCVRLIEHYMEIKFAVPMPEETRGK